VRCALCGRWLTAMDMDDKTCNACANKEEE